MRFTHGTLLTLVVLALGVVGSLHAFKYFYPPKTILTVEVVGFSNMIVTLERVGENGKMAPPIFATTDEGGKTYFIDLPVPSKWRVSLVSSRRKVINEMIFSIPEGTVNSKITFSGSSSSFEVTKP
ncbi:MAG: hypothetical protein HYW89_03780 [Candidatus Sungiibacteriota bacterium]|uniref:Uncharacterized protein n=1 Tax=Candidatus Sungiibacteriota bacterium TaxID=2750080 RepID=A0A7T5UQE1_9BACT|nr:MAG: hypothetical protein HYW89_03780 [Candidatus Sungbacteria bacterium]